jgi:phenylpyruvate tautomerase PptA (4-oxalocrotonate tautomerase family)
MQGEAMPLVRIALRRGKPRDYRRAIADAVHRALVDGLGVPPDDRFQIVTEHDGDELIYDRNYLGVARSDDTIFIQVSLRRGRTTAVKQAFFRQVVANLAADPGIRPEDVAIVLTENGDDDWSFGRGEMQLVGAGAPAIRTVVPA